MEGGRWSARIFFVIFGPVEEEGGHNCGQLPGGISHYADFPRQMFPRRGPRTILRMSIVFLQSKQIICKTMTVHEVESLRTFHSVAPPAWKPSWPPRATPKCSRS